MRNVCGNCATFLSEPRVRKWKLLNILALKVILSSWKIIISGKIVTLNFRIKYRSMLVSIPSLFVVAFRKQVILRLIRVLKLKLMFLVF